MEKLEKNKSEAINCIQDLIDVANCHGSSCVYKHNGGVARLENVLECLKNCEPVIRCRDCRYFAPNLSRPEDFGACCCHGTPYSIHPSPNFFCACGEPVNKPVESVNNS